MTSKDEELKKEEEEESFYSRHIYLFPFKWETSVLPTGRVRTVGSTIDLDKAERALFARQIPPLGNEVKPQEGTWYRPHFQLDRLNHFNEYNYFYDYVNEIIYDLHDNLKMHKEQLQLLRHYEYEVTAGLQYEIRVEMGKDNEDKVYFLELDAVNLNLYETGVGVMSLFMTNRKQEQSNPEDILRINQFGRRIAPPFLGLDPDGIGQDYDFKFEEPSAKAGLATTQKAELATSVSLFIKDGQPLAEENFTKYTNEQNILKGPFLLPSFLTYFFPAPGNLITQDADWGPHGQVGKLFLKPVLDDRMFVVCWYGGMAEVTEAKKKAHQEAINKNITAQYRGSLDQFEQGGYLNPNAYEGKFWYKFLFVDGQGMSTSNMDMAKKLLAKHSYVRWAPYSYFGISRYSLVLLTSSFANLKDNNVAFLPQHLESIYYKMFELAIVQRASVLRFADEVTQVFTFEKDKQEDLPALAEQVADLYKHYIRFINKVYFREVTAQDQGIEMYDLLQKHMRIETQVEDLDKEIQELHNYVSLQEEKEREMREKKATQDAKDREVAEKKRDDETQQKLNAITILGALLLIPGFLVALYDLPVFKNAVEALPPWAWIAIFLGQLSLGLSSLRMVGIQFNIPLIRRLNQFKNQWGWLISSFVLLIALTFGVYYIGECCHQAQQKCQEQKSAPTTPSDSLPISSDSASRPLSDTLSPVNSDSLPRP